MLHALSSSVCTCQFMCGAHVYASESLLMQGHVQQGQVCSESFEGACCTLLCGSVRG